MKPWYYWRQWEFCHWLQSSQDFTSGFQRIISSKVKEWCHCQGTGSRTLNFADALRSGGNPFSFLWISGHLCKDSAPCTLVPWYNEVLCHHWRPNSICILSSSLRGVKQKDRKWMLFWITQLLLYFYKTVRDIYLHLSPLQPAMSLLPQLHKLQFATFKGKGFCYLRKRDILFYSLECPHSVLTSQIC